MNKMASMGLVQLCFNFSGLNYMIILLPFIAKHMPLCQKVALVDSIALNSTN